MIEEPKRILFDYAMTLDQVKLLMKRLVYVNHCTKKDFYSKMERKVLYSEKDELIMKLVLSSRRGSPYISDIKYCLDGQHKRPMIQVTVNNESFAFHVSSDLQRRIEGYLGKPYGKGKMYLNILSLTHLCTS